ncbi:MAG: cyclic nucleotide-binding domain-containing protein [Anaerolineales bacterium]
MKTVMVIPTYWSRESAVGWQPGDAVYDHPTPLDQEGTLVKTLESLRILENSDFSLVILACATAGDIEAQVEARVREITKAVDPPVETFVISHSHLRRFQETLTQGGREDLIDVLSLWGYSNIRNMCLYVPYVLGAEVVVLIDDDEYFDDPLFVDKTSEFIGSRFMGQTIDGVAGYYLNAQGTYYDDVPEEIHWMTYWDRFGSKREAFDKVIPGEPRLKVTPFAFGGCMVVHRALFRTVPFDPRISRGEDTDYVLNARMFGFNFFLDNQLYIQHRPPEKSHPTWQRFREDIFRLLYTKAKIDGQTEQVNMNIVEAEDFDPYPGEFLRDTLDDKILKTNLILALDYLADQRIEDTKETIRNVWLAQTKAIPSENPFETYLVFQRRWRELRKLTRRQLGPLMYEIIVGGNVRLEEEARIAEAMREKSEHSSEEDVRKLVTSFPMFNGLSRQQVDALIALGKREFYVKDDVLFNEGTKEHDLFLILQGRAVITMSNHSDEVVGVAEASVGETLGEVSMLIGAPHSASVIAMEPMEVLCFTRRRLAALMANDPELAARLWHSMAQSLGNRLRNSNARYMTYASEIQDVADELIQTSPLDGDDSNES